MTSPNATATARLAARIVALEKAVKNLSSPQLANSSIEDGAIQVKNGRGETVAIIGVKPGPNGEYIPDAAGGVFPMGGPKPPRPSRPIVTPGIQSLTVRWDGGYENGSLPENFMRMEVHLTDAPNTFQMDNPETLRGTIESPQGGEVVISPLAVRQRWVLLVARSASGVPSDPSEEVAATPKSVVSDEEIAEINADIAANVVALAELDADLEENRVRLGELRVALDENEVALAQLRTDLNTNNAELEKNRQEIAKVGTTANGKGKVWFTPDPPVASSEFDIWFETDMDNRPYKRENGQWVLTGFGNLAVGNLDAAHITFGTMHGDRIAVNTLNADRITANTIHGDKITANTINGDRIIANTIHGDRIIANTIQGDRIIGNSIHGDKITGNTLNGDKIIGNTIHGDKIIGDTITGNKIRANQIVGVHIAGRVILADHIKAGEIYAEHVNTFAITGKVVRTRESGAKVLIHSNDINQVRFDTQFTSPNVGFHQDTTPHIRSGTFYPDYDITNIEWGPMNNMQTALVLNSGSMYHNPPRESSLVLFGAAEDNSQSMFTRIQSDRLEFHGVRSEVQFKDQSELGDHRNTAFVYGFRIGPLGSIGSTTVGFMHTGSNGGNNHIDVRGGAASTYISWYSGSGMHVSNGSQGRGRLVAGEVNYTSLVNASSRLVKLNITPMATGALAKLKQMTPVRYKYNPAKLPGVDDKTRLSLIAEDVQLLLPEVIETSVESIADPTAPGYIRYEDRLGINTHSLLAFVIMAIKELETRVSNIETGGAVL